MNVEEARLVLGLSEEEILDEECVSDIYDEQLFTIKRYWLTNPVVPILFRKRLQQLERAFLAKDLLMPSINEKQLETPELKAYSLQEENLISEYEKSVAELKMGLSKLSLYPDIKDCIEQLIALQQHFESILLLKVISYFGEPQNWPEGFDKDGKISIGIDTVLIAKALKMIEAGASSPLIQNNLLSEVYKVVKKQNLAKRI